MCENSVKMLFVTFYAFISLFGISSTEYVPVFLWETTQFSEIVPALERVNQEFFTKIIADRTTKDTPVVLFAEQNLSPEDFILRDAEGNSPFTNIAVLKTTAQTSYWPSVKNPIKAILELKDRTKVEASIKSILDDPNFTIHDNDLLIVDLNDAGEGEDRIQMLQRHDKAIAEIYKRLFKQHKNLITLFTAHHPSWIISEDLRSHRRARDTNKPDEPVVEEKPKPKDDTHQIYSNADIMMYLSDTGSFSAGGDPVSVTQLSGFDTITTSNRTENGMEIALKFKTPKVITITFDFGFASGYWLMNGIEVDADSKKYVLRVSEVYAPEVFSYHCTAQQFANIEDPTVFLVLPGFQVQPIFSGTLEKFGDVYDCVGFMTAPIWSGLFVTFILALIMTLGLTMMMDIKTMDRFDDPKGKTISITATE